MQLALLQYSTLISKCNIFLISYNSNIIHNLKNTLSQLFKLKCVQLKSTKWETGKILTLIRNVLLDINRFFLLKTILCTSNSLLNVDATF